MEPLVEHGLFHHAGAVHDDLPDVIPTDKSVAVAYTLMDIGVTWTSHVGVIHTVRVCRCETVVFPRHAGADRIWIFPRGGRGVKMIPAGNLVNEASSKWTEFFTERYVLDLYVEGDGVWVSTTDGLFHVSLGADFTPTDDDVWTDFSEVSALLGQQVLRIFIDSSGVKWFSSDKGIVTLDDGGRPEDSTSNIWRTPPPMRNGAEFVTSSLIAMDADDMKWFQTPDGAVYRTDATMNSDDDSPLYHPALCPDFAEVQAPPAQVQIDADGYKWILSNGILYRLDDGGTPVNESDDIWIRVRPLRNTDQRIVDIIPRLEGSGVWVATSGPVHGPLSCNTALWRLDPGDPQNSLDDFWQAYPRSSYYISCLRMAGYDSDGYFWLKSSSPNGGMGPWYWVDDNGTPVDIMDDRMGTTTGSDDISIEFSNIAGFFEEGIIVFANTLFKRRLEPDTPADGSWIRFDSFAPACAAEEPKDGGIWTGYTNAVNPDDVPPPPLRHLNNGGTPLDTGDDLWIDFTREDGLQIDKVKQIQIDNTGMKWMVGTADDGSIPGLVSFNDNKTPTDKSDDRWTYYTANDGLIGTAVTSISIDENDDIWISTNSGVNYLHLNR